MRSSIVWDESNALPMSGRATLATNRFRLAIAATRISEVSTSPARRGEASAPVAPPGAGAAAPAWAEVPGGRVIRSGPQLPPRPRWASRISSALG